MVKQEPLEAIRITLQVTQELDKLGVLHVVAGSLASSLHGIPRATNDVDIVAALREQHVDAFVRALEGGFYIDADMIREAIARRGEFNVIELTTMFKVDVFVPLMDIVIRKELQRGVMVVVDHERNLSMRLATAEDVVVHKLSWYRRGGAVSDRQWSDTLGVLVVQQGKLDLPYLRETAMLLDVSDLLDRALAEAYAP